MVKTYNPEKVFELVSEWFASHQDDMIKLSERIWKLAEIMYEEFESRKVLMDELNKQGFVIFDGLKNLPTGFMAEWSLGKGPVIALLGEYDALPGLGYEVADTPQPTGANGHGCGHNLLGVGSLAAAIAVKTVMAECNIEGTIRYYGCPAEEGYGAKVEMVHNGNFDGIDAVFRWHPQNFTYVSMASTLRYSEIKYQFHGRKAHTQTFPHLGRSALDAAVLMDIAVNYLREHVPDNHIRISSVITNGGGTQPTIVPDFAEIFYSVSAVNRVDSEDVVKRINKIAQGIAMATETTVDIIYGAACSEVLPNRAMSVCMLGHLKQVGPPLWTAEEKTFAARLDKDTLPVNKARTMSIYRITDPHVMETSIYEDVSEEMIENGIGLFSTDSADPSWIAPMGSLFVASMPIGSAVHSWQQTVCSGMSIGQKAMLIAGKTLALTAINAMADEELLNRAREEFNEQLRQKPYVNPLDSVY